MLDPRIYRMSLVIPALALIVLAFSLSTQPGGLRSSLAPGVFNGANVRTTMHALQARYPVRTAGSPADRSMAADVVGSLRSSAEGFTVTQDRFSAPTVHGERELSNVIATRPGTASSGGAIVVVAPRDGPGAAGLSPTAMLVELGRDLGGETLDRTVILASVSGSTGALGTRRLAAELPRPIDAVVVLGDLASARQHRPVIVPWTSRMAIAPARLSNTLSVALSQAGALNAGAPDLADQLAHLAFPLTISDQGPLGTTGLPAVELSLSGERGPSAGGPLIGPGRLERVGQAVFSAVSALDDGPGIPAPSAYVVFAHQIVPMWAIELFVLALLIPVALTTVDGLARARRRRHPVGRGLLAVLAAALPFLVAGAVVIIAGAVGALPTPPGAVGAGAVGAGAGAIAVLAVALLAALGSGVVVHGAFASAVRAQAAQPVRRGRDGPTPRSDDGIAASMLLVLCVVAIDLWFVNPFAAALLVPALHLWLWAVDSDLSLPAPIRVLMLVLAAVPTAAVVVFYARSLGFDPWQLGWTAVLLLSGHVVSWVGLVLWSIVLGCGLTGLTLVVAAARRPAPVAPPATVRGPVGYAGPGSLGGTKSALPRR